MSRAWHERPEAFTASGRSPSSPRSRWACSLSAGEGEPASPQAGAGVLRLCADPDNLPFSSAAPGERGLYVDLAELVAARLGVGTEYAWWYTFYGKRAVRNTLLADRCDAFFGLPHDTDFMGRNLILTRAFLDVGWAIIAPGRVAFARIDELKARRLAVVFRSMPQLLLAMRGGFQTSTFRTDEDALEALARGEVDAAFVWGPTAGYQNLRKLGGAYRIVLVAGRDYSGGRPSPCARAARRCAIASTPRSATLQPEIRQLADRYGFPRGPAIGFAGDATAPDRRRDDRGGSEPVQPALLALSRAECDEPRAEPGPAPAAVTVRRLERGGLLHHGHARPARQGHAAVEQPRRREPAARLGVPRLVQTEH